MITKIRAAKVCNDFGCDMAIVNGNQPNVLIDLIEGKDVGTYFDGKPGRLLNSRQHWIMYRSMPKGTIVVDEGAKKASYNPSISLTSTTISALTAGTTSDANVSLSPTLISSTAKVSFSLIIGTTSYSINACIALLKFINRLRSSKSS